MEIRENADELKFISRKTLLATTKSTMHYSNLYQSFSIEKANYFNRWMGKRVLVDAEGSFGYEMHICDLKNGRVMSAIPVSHYFYAYVNHAKSELRAINGDTCYVKDSKTLRNREI